MKLKNRIKKIGAGLMASLCAISVIGGPVTVNNISASAALTVKNTAFPTADEVIAEAATLLGSPYGWGSKGYTGIYYQNSYSPLDLKTVRSQGVDCSGLIYYTLTHLGYSTSGFSWNNPVPVDTYHWLTVDDKCTITYKGITSKIDVEKANIPYKERPYWECADGSAITPGSVVIADNTNGEDHSWIYMGEFDSRNDVIAYLKSIGVNESYINNKTVGDGKGDGGTHWRIESNGTEGCVINNRTDGKKATSMNMYAFRIAQDNATFMITKVLSTDNSVKISGKSSIDGSEAVYGVFTDKACTKKVSEIAIGADGTGSIKLPNKQYYVKEIKAPTGYDLSPDIVPLKANSNVNVEEDISSGKILINKTSEDGNAGDREFKVTWTDSEKKHSKTAVTDENGIAEFDGLHVYDFSTKAPITYTVSEENVPDRYVIPAEQTASFTASETVTVKFDNVLKKGNISIIKHSDDEDDTVENLESGAEFEVYLKSAGSYDKAKETERDILVTDKNGYAKTKDMPYGIYTVHQVKTVNDAAFAADFDVNIVENGKTYEYILNNKPFRSYIHVTKVDAETGKTIPYESTGFQIYDSNGNLVNLGTDTFYTNNEGILITPESLKYGDYTLIEVQAPVGYVLDSTPVPFTVNADNASEEKAVNIIRVTKADTAQKGRISVSKHGDIFTSVQAIAPAIWADESGEIHTVGTSAYYPVFEESGLSGAEFEVIAAEDIITPDGTIRVNAGDIVASLITDENGYAETEPLYLGKYEIKETAAPYGYVRNTETKAVELTYAGQEAAVTDTAVRVNNDYQKVNIHFEKTMEHDELFSIGGNEEYRNVEFGLFAAEDITAADGAVIPEDGLVAQVSLSEGLSATITEKIPFGQYYVQEIATDEHYVINGEKYLVNFEYMGQEMTTVDINCGTFVNDLKRGSVNGKKVSEHGEPLEKAIFGLFRADETEFTAESAYLTSTSDEDGNFGFADIPCGRYMVKEIAAPEGYILSDKEYPVEITENGDAVEITVENDTAPEENVPPTGDTGRSTLGYVMLIAGIFGIFLSVYKYRKIAKETDESEDDLSSYCPDFIEGDGNE